MALLLGYRFRIAVVMVVLSGCVLGTAQPATTDGKTLVILRDTGQERDGLPRLEIEPDSAAAAGMLSRGFSGRLLRLYRWEQEYLHRVSGSAPEPAYLLLSRQQGGFPRFGFYLGEQDKRTAGYVNLHRSGALNGRFGSMDQIFPHELAHIIVRQLAGEKPRGNSSQMHAIGICTDPYEAFSEGFAEHFQIMAIDDPEADPATKALATDDDLRKTAERQAVWYRDELKGSYSPFGPLRMGFLFWFGGTEQVWRYFSVKQNAFAHENEVPPAMMAAKDPYLAYLLQNVTPGEEQAPPKSAARMLSTEGVVSALFYRWATNHDMQQSYRGEEFYAQFGITRGQVSPLENCYLKIFHMLFIKKPADTAAFIDGYKSVFPDESRFVDVVTHDVFLGRQLSATPAIWLANRDFHTGSSLYDQFRSLPRSYTFDLNAASSIDLMGVPGMTPGLAKAILDHAPFSSLNDMARVPGMSPAIMEKFDAMSKEMVRLAAESGEDEEGLSLGTILWSYIWRALIVLVIATTGGALLYRRVMAKRWLRCVINGVGASLLVLFLAWITTGATVRIAFAGPMMVFGVPAALIHLARYRRMAPALGVLLAWAGATIPAILLVYL